MKAEPLRLKPQVKEVVWGGRWLATELGRPGAEGANLGESWEAYSGSVVQTGSYAGRTLGELFTEYGAKLFGEAAAAYPKFPLLVKFIDAHQNLSIQVHPNNALAQQLENYPYGKTEFWYVLEAAPGAEIIYGLTDEADSREALQEALARQEFLRCCARVPVQPGDVVFLPAGTVHALTEGVVIYELQQDSDITYRLYDWGRTDRQIHIEKGLQSIDLEARNLKPAHPEPTIQNGYTSAVLVKNEFFHSELLKVEQPTSMAGSDGSFILLSVIDGAGVLLSEQNDFETAPLRKGDTLFVPARLNFILRAQTPEAPMTVILSRLV